MRDQSGWILAKLSCVALVIAATWAAYANSLSGPFLFDDVLRIANDPTIRIAWPPWQLLSSSNRPFAMFTFALNYAAHDYEVAGYHLTNLAIHIAAALTLLGLVVRSWLHLHADRAVQAWGLGLAVSLVWALHPLNTQAVSYIIQRVEALMALCALLTLYGFIRAQSARYPRFWYLFSIVCCAIGMGCKEVMVTAPILVLWYDRALVAKSWKELLRNRWCYYLLLASTWCVLAWAMWHYQAEYRSGALLNVENLGPWTYLTNQAAVITRYLQLAFYPANQCAYYAWPVEHSIVKLLPYLALIVSLLLLALWLSYVRPVLGWLAMSFFVTLAPTSSVAPIIDLAFEHRMYLPLGGVVALTCYAIGKCLGLLETTPGPRPSTLRLLTACFLLIAVSIALGATTHARNVVYASEKAFWKDVTTKSPANVSAWLGLGSAYAKEQDSDEAENCFRQALQLAPDKAKPQATYAGLLIARGQYTEAEELLAKAGQSEPTLVEYVINQGLLLSLTGKFEEAQTYLEAGVRAAPDDEELQTNLVVNLCYLRQFEQALAVAQANRTARPGSARATNDVAACWWWPTVMRRPLNSSPPKRSN